MTRQLAILVHVVAVIGSASGANADTSYGALSLDAGGRVSGFAQHPSGRLYGFGDSFGVYRSDDFGARWRFVQNGMTENATSVHALAVSPLDPDRVAFSGPTNLWSSGDGGETWAKLLDDLASIFTRGSRPLAYHPTNVGELWFAGNRKKLTRSLWRSTDDGKTWSAVGGPEFENERAVTIHLLPGAPNEIWVGTAAVRGKSTAGGLWCSVDGGSTWRKIWDNGGALTKFHGAAGVGCIARNANRVSVFASNNGIWQVAAADWKDPLTYVAKQRALQDQNVVNVTTLADGTFWASDLGEKASSPLVSADGATWTERPMRMSAACVPEWTTAQDLSEANRIMGREILVQDVMDPTRWLLTGNGAAHLSEDNGATWRYRPGGMAGVVSHGVHFDQTNRNRVYLSTGEHGIFVVNDGGFSGKTIRCSRHAFNEAHTYHSAMTSADGQTIVAAGVDEVSNRTVIVRSENGGATWDRITPTGLPLNHEGVTRAVISMDDPNDFLVLLGYRFGHTGTYHDALRGQPDSPGLYRTRDGGKTFVQVGGHRFEGVDTGAREKPEHAYLERDGVNPNIRYLALRSPRIPTAAGLWRSTDGGTTWRRRTDHGGGGAIHAFAVDPAVEGRLWIGVGRLLRSDDGGDNWLNVGDFETVTSVSCHAGRIAVLGRRNGDEFNKIYASGDNGATWKEMTSNTNRMMWARSVTVDPRRAGQIWVAGPRSYQIINPPRDPDPMLKGTAYGVADAANAFDGRTETSSTSADNGKFTGLDLGKGRAAQVTTIRYYLRGGFEAGMHGGRFEGSIDGATWTPLAHITMKPAAGWQTLPLGETRFFRYLRYWCPTGAGELAEVGFHGLAANAPTFVERAVALTMHSSQSFCQRIEFAGHPQPEVKVTSGELPRGLLLNPHTGVVTGTPLTAGKGSVTVEATNLHGSDAVPVSFAVIDGPRISAQASHMHFLDVRTGADVPVTVSNNGSEPLEWSAAPQDAGWITSISPAKGTLAPGTSATLSVSLSAAGMVDGKVAIGRLTFASNDPVRSVFSVPIRVTAGTPPAVPVIKENQRAEGHRGGPFSFALSASNNLTRWDITFGKLPGGLELDPDIGIVYGTPTEVGEFPLQFTATNAGGMSRAGTATLTISEAPTGANYNFNMGQAHFEATFLQTPGTPWASNVGVGRSGGLIADSNEHSAILPAPLITFTAAGQAIKLGVSFQARVDPRTAGGENIRLGLRSQKILPLTGDFLDVGINKAANQPITSALATGFRAGQSSASSKDTDPLVLENKHWYAIEAEITYDGGDRFTIVSKLYHLGETGGDKAEVMDSHTTTHAHVPAMVNVPLYASFSGKSSGGFGGVLTFDNFFARFAE